MSTPTIKIDGVRYYVEAKDPNHGFKHRHEEDHADGTSGEVPHHHHDEMCEWLPAMLKPVRPRKQKRHRTG